MTLAQPTHRADAAAATRALFARVSRKSQVVVPLNAAAADRQASGPAFYCVHSIAGAGGTDFLAMTRHMGERVRVFGIQAPPARMDEPEFGASVRELAAAYAEAICLAQPSGPVALAGWSAGAPVALEIAHRLRDHGRETALLVAIDGAPVLSAGLKVWDPRYWLRVLANLPAWFVDSRRMDPGFPGTTIARIAKSFLSRAEGLVRRRKPEVAPELEGLIDLDRYPAAQRGFMSRLYEAIMRYQPETWDGPVTVYEARIGPAASLPQYLERWRPVAPRAEGVRIEGNHVTIMREPWVAELARDLERRIMAAFADRAEAG
jgi:thioesterase domain-containing protein